MRATGSRVDSAAPFGEAAGGWPMVLALATAQLASWGTIYYSFSLFVLPMEAELGWSRASLNGALSVGLLCAGLCAYGVGAWIDRRGGRALMSGGTLLSATLLALWSQVGSLTALYAIWIGLGVAMAAILYEPVFAVLTRSFPESFRNRITVLTFIAGFASTVFIPLTQMLIDRIGWRDTLLALAAINLAVCLPVHLFWLRDHVPTGTTPVGDAAARQAPLRRALRHPVFWALTLCLTCYSATFSALTFHIIPLLAERGIATAVAISAVALIGPSQVAGRLLVFLLGARLPTAVTGRAVVLALPASLLLLILFPQSVAVLFLAAALYGGANGIMTILRGTAVPDLMWPEGYGAINGALALPSMAALAGAPLGAALIWSAAGGYGAVLWALFATAMLAAAAFWAAAALAGRNR